MLTGLFKVTYVSIFEWQTAKTGFTFLIGKTVLHGFSSSQLLIQVACPAETAILRTRNSQSASKNCSTSPAHAPALQDLLRATFHASCRAAGRQWRSCTTTALAPWGRVLVHGSPNCQMVRQMPHRSPSRVLAISCFISFQSISRI